MPRRDSGVKIDPSPNRSAGDPVIPDPQRHGLPLPGSTMALLGLRILCAVVPALTLVVFLASPVHSALNLLRIAVAATIVVSTVLAATGLAHAALSSWLPAVFRLRSTLVLAVLLPAGALAALGSAELMRALPVALLATPPLRVAILGMLVGAVHGLGLEAEERFRRHQSTALERWRQERSPQSGADPARALVEPHFLFNSLNALAGLIHGHPERAEAMALRLARLFRRGLEAGDGTVRPLAAELDLLEEYLAIENERLGGQLEIDVDRGSPELSAYPVPDLLLLPLVDNAVKHGVAQRPEGGRVRIRGDVDAHGLRLEVRDDGPGKSSAPGTGRGLALVRSRLAWHAGEAASLQLWRDREAGETVAEVRLPRLGESP